MIPFHEMEGDTLTPECLQHELQTRGYVLIRGLLPLRDLCDVLRRILPILSAADWLLPNHNLLERRANRHAACGDSDPAFDAVYRKIFRLEAFHALAHHPRLREVMRQIVGPRLLVHPKPIGRLIFPECERFVIHAHQDHLAVGGDPDCYTAWLPLHDCPPELGPLRILEGSHRFGHQEANPATGMIADEEAKGSAWVGGRINAGDVLIFHSLTVHSASPNRSRQLRISLDCRFQDYAHALNPANIVFPGSDARTWEEVYAGWRSAELRYFWKSLPLTFSPSVEELAILAETDPSPRMRTRYTRILRQLRLQSPSPSTAQNLAAVAVPE